MTSIFCLVKSLLLCLTKFLMVWYRYPFDPCFTFRHSGYLQGQSCSWKDIEVLQYDDGWDEVEG